MCTKCGNPNPTDSVWCDFCRDEESGFPAHMRERAWAARGAEIRRRYSWRLRGHR